ncbi:MAG: DUF938 domain-containing protein, partial [Alphaproteobacteria bacterium]|nr:DUF938 domain-containing protein [Alphaproteobacteria bacterium]
VLPPVRIDAAAPDWPDAVPNARADAVISANLIHIAPWSVCLGLLAGAARLLGDDGLLCFYGPFNVDGQYTSEGNAAFDRSLRGQDPEWGLRDVSDLCDAAATLNFRLWKTFPMPANNLTLVFRRTLLS